MKVMSASYRTVIAGLAASTVLGIHTGAAFAQQTLQANPDPSGVPQPAAGPEQAQAQPQPQPAPQQYPPGYAPPPGYGPPPQGYGSAPPPRYSYYPPPPPPPAKTTTERAFMIGGSLGLGGLRFYNDVPVATSGPATGYSLRLGFGIAPRLLLLVGLEGAVSVENDLVYDQSVYYVGVQAFLTRKLFVRGGGGIGNITGKDNYGDFLYFGKTGLGLTGTVGIELLQGYNWSMELAGHMTSGFYKDERWTSGTINIGINFF